MYAIINFRGVQPLYLPAVWELKVPPESRCSYGFSRRIKCEMCREIEFVYHLFFECVVATEMWKLVSQIFKVDIVDLG